MIIESTQLYGLYPKEIKDDISFEREDISFDIFIFTISDLGLFPIAGPHQLLHDSELIKKHEEQVFIDSIRKVKNKSYSGLVLIDYRGRWHPHFDYSKYESSDGFFTEKDFDNKVCSSGKLFYDDKNYREDFFNYLYCSDPDSVKSLDINTELESYVKERWNEISRSFYEATIRGVRKALPNAKIGFIDLPTSIYKNSNLVESSPGVVGYGNRFDEVTGDAYNTGQRINNEMSWLWNLIDVLSPSIKRLG